MKTNHEKEMLKEVAKLKGKVKFLHLQVVLKDRVQRQTVCVLKIADKYYMMNSKCSEKDEFDRKIGRAIALGRTYQSYKDKKYVNKKNIAQQYLFKEDRSG